MNAPLFRSGELAHGRRRSPRLRLHVIAELVLVNNRMRCLLDDISQTGAQLSVPCAVPCQVDALLTCGGVECFGEIVWTAPGRCGIQFEAPLPHATVVAMRTIGEDLEEIERAARLRAARDWVTGGSAKP